MDIPFSIGCGRASLRSSAHQNWPHIYPSLSPIKTGFSTTKQPKKDSLAAHDPIAWLECFFQNKEEEKEEKKEEE